MPHPLDDSFYSQHFQRWLEDCRYEDEREEIRALIWSLLEDDPELINDHSWSEMELMARSTAH